MFADAVKFEEFQMGKPVKIITTDDTAWQWKGDWLNKEGVVEWHNKYKGKLRPGATNGKWH